MMFRDNFVNYENIHVLRLSSICCNLTTIAVKGFITSKLDYYFSLSANLTDASIRLLKSIPHATNRANEII